jgi:hypothetical protein
MAPNTAPFLARSSIATNLITVFLIRIKHLAFVYGLVTVATPVLGTAGGFVEFPARQGVGQARG